MSQVRRIIDLLSRISAVAAGICLVTIAGLVTVQILARMAGFVVLSGDILSGYALAGSVFLALPYTFQKGSHVRVSLLLGRVRADHRPKVELLALSIAAVLIGYFAYFSLNLTLDFHRFGDVSSGSIAIPLWIPQTMMTTGLALFFIVIVADIVAVLRGDIPSYLENPETLTDLG